MKFISDHMIKLVVVIVIFINVMVFYTVGQDKSVYHDLCIEKGGYVLNTRSNSYCIDKTVIIDIDENIKGVIRNE